MCVIFISWLGKMARNSHSIARHFNAAMESIGRAVRPINLNRHGYSIAINPGAWEYDYIRHEIIHHLQAENVGLLFDGYLFFRFFREH